MCVHVYMCTWQVGFSPVFLGVSSLGIGGGEGSVWEEVGLVD